MLKRRKSLRKKSFNKRRLLKYFLLLAVLAVCGLFFYLSPKYKADTNPMSIFPPTFSSVEVSLPGMGERDIIYVAAERISKDKYINKYQITKLLPDKSSIEGSSHINYDFKNIDHNRWWLIREGDYYSNKKYGCDKYRFKTTLYPFSEKDYSTGWLYYDDKCTKKIPGSDGNAAPTNSSGSTSTNDSGSSTTTTTTNNSSSDDSATTPTNSSNSASTTATATLDHQTVSKDSAPTFALKPSTETDGGATSGKIEVGLNPDGTSGGSYEWKGYIKTFYYYAIRLGAALVVLMLVFAGYTYVTSNGDSSKLGTAKERVFGAIIGYLLLLFVGFILNYLGLSK